MVIITLKHAFCIGFLTLLSFFMFQNSERAIVDSGLI
jgi:hypothetical protein